ncbi:MAG: adenine phosphoribosyltransferase [Acidimicrobiales bacterium]|nr:adenine phosphoribosyltransferase [Acidimicrobiales bacterium]
MSDRAAWLRSLVRDIPDYPVEGVLFRDITPLLAEPGALKAATDLLAEPFAGQTVDRVVGIEARGFIFGAPLADALGTGFVPIRKPGKLPGPVVSQVYELEYGTDEMQVQADAIEPGMHVVIADDVLATGGTLAAAGALVEQCGGTVVGHALLIELTALGGRAKLDAPLYSVIEY